MSTSTAEPGMISVIIPVRDDAEQLARCLRALTRQTHGRMEVLVVDNGSTEDLTPAMPDDPRFRLLSEPRPGSYAARNAALAVASGSILAFTDADCVPEPTWLEEGARALVADPRADMVGGAVHLFYAGDGPVTGAELYESKHAFLQESYLRTQQYAVTANMLTWRSVVDRVGPFDARLMSRGDAEFGQRVARSGGRQRYAEAAIVHHPARATSAEMVAKFARTTRGRRDVDLIAGRGRRHFLAMAREQAYIMVRMTAAVLFAHRSPHGYRPKLRYLRLFIRLRLLQIGVYLGAAARGRGRGTDRLAQPSPSSPH